MSLQRGNVLMRDWRERHVHLPPLQASGSTQDPHLPAYNNIVTRLTAFNEIVVEYHHDRPWNRPYGKLGNLRGVSAQRCNSS